MLTIDYRREDLARMQADLAAYQTAGNAEIVAILTPQIATLADQIATYDDSKDADAHFVDANGYTAAMNAYAEIGELEIQAVVNAEIVATFHRGEITAPQIFADLAEELAGQELPLNVEGYLMSHDGNRITMTAPNGEARSFPIPRIA